MQVIDRNSILWSYLQDEIKGLVVDGEVLLTHMHEMPTKISDYSFLVFPFAKAYEGFLKRLFLDMNLIKEDEYFSDEIRIGRILNPHYAHENKNVFDRICSRPGEPGAEVAKLLWSTWKLGRNQLFHFFPHNYKKITLEESYEIINKIVLGMETVVTQCRIKI